MEHNNWFRNGVYGGQLVESTIDAIVNIGADSTICINVLDVASRDESFVNTLNFQSWLEDIKEGRLGEEWISERQAITSNTYETFSYFWPTLRKRIISSHLVSEVSLLERFIVSMIVEFSHENSAIKIKNLTTDNIFENLIQKADDIYRRSVKANKSTSKAWIKICNELIMPASIKSGLNKWHDDQKGLAIDEMILVRNAIVHRGGIADFKLAGFLNVPENTQVQFNDRLLRKYSDSYIDFIFIIDPPL